MWMCYWHARSVDIFWHYSHEASPFRLILRTNWILRLLSALTDTRGPFFPACSLSISLLSPCIVYLSVWQMPHETTEQKSGGNRDVKTEQELQRLEVARINRNGQPMENTSTTLLLVSSVIKCHGCYVQQSCCRERLGWISSFKI